MTRTIRCFVALAFAVGATVLALPTPALALNADAAAILGQGVYNPFLGALPAAHATYMNGNAPVLGTHGFGTTYACAFAGNEIGDFAESNGVFAGNCGPILLNNCVYVRVGSWEPVACVEIGPQIRAATMLLEVVPNQIPPSPTANFNFAGPIVFGEINSP